MERAQLIVNGRTIPIHQVIDETFLISHDIDLYVTLYSDSHSFDTRKNKEICLRNNIQYISGYLEKISIPKLQQKLNGNTLIHYRGDDADAFSMYIFNLL
jgi:hypothetical protein